MVAIGSKLPHIHVVHLASPQFTATIPSTLVHAVNIPLPCKKQVLLTTSHPTIKLPRTGEHGILPISLVAA